MNPNNETFETPERPILAKPHLLATLLAPFLDSTCLGSMAMTSKSLNEAFSPSLWEALTFRPCSVDTGKPKYTDPVFAQTLEKHGKNVREIRIFTKTDQQDGQPDVSKSLSTFLDVVQQYCPNVIRIVAFYDPPRSNLIADFMRFYDHRLLSVHLMPYDLADAEWVHCLQATSQLYELKKLRIDFLPMYIVYVLLHTMPSASRHLKEVEFGISTEDKSELSVLVSKRQERPFEGREERLDAFRDTIEQKFKHTGLVSVLRNCSRIFRDPSGWSSPSSSSPLTDVYFSPDTFTLHLNTGESNRAPRCDYFEYFFEFIPEHSLSRLELGRMFATENRLLHISRNQQNIKTLYITSLAPNVSSEVLLNLLVSCKKLESIDVLSPHQIFDHGGDAPSSALPAGVDVDQSLQASGLVGPEAWGCTNLKRWNVHLSSFCLLCQSNRPDESQESCLEEEETKDKLAQFWQQLGKMKQLKTLGFGHCLDQNESTDSSRYHSRSEHDNTNRRQELFETRADFNEAIEHLAGLSDLEDITLCNEVMHQTTKESLQQWRATWPKLRMVHGCSFKSEHEAEDVLKWVKDNIKTLSLTHPRKGLL